MFPALTVSQLTSRIKEHLEGLMPHVEVQGEVSNFRHQSSGHLYFSIKDQFAQLSIVMFRARAGGLTRLPRDGDLVIISGSLSVYAPRGSYQLLAEQLRFGGTGDLLLEVEKRKQKLAALGYFDIGGKQSLPYLPKTIAVVTSPTGAVIRDILHVLERRFPGQRVLICPVRVQGDEAISEIETALATIARHRLADAIIIARGGGSIEDLMPFNGEQLVLAVHRCPIPVISAVGHETDTTLCDLATDRRAPTPSAAAELIVPEKRALRANLAQWRQALTKPLLMRLRGQRQTLLALRRHPCIAQPQRTLATHWQRLDDLQDLISRRASERASERHAHHRRLRQVLAAQTPARRLVESQAQLARLRQEIGARFSALFATLHDKLGQTRKMTNRALERARSDFRTPWERLAPQRRLIEAWHSRQTKWREHLQVTGDLLAARDPHVLMRRGYAIVFPDLPTADARSAPLTSAAVARSTRKLRIHFADGDLRAQVDE